MTDEWEPTPEAAGGLNPPRRRPPTALGLLTPPPPRRPKRSVYRPSSLRRRLAQAFLGASGAFAGVAVVSIAAHPVGVIVGSLVALAGARLLGISVRVAPAARVRQALHERAPTRDRAA